MTFNQIVRSLTTAVLAILIASSTSDGIRYDSAASLITAMLVLGVFNIFLKPLLLLFSLPFIILTLGVGIWIINALLLLLVAALVNGFFVDGFLNALWGALVLGLINLIATFYFGDPRQSRFTVNLRRGSRFQKGRTSRQSRNSIKEDEIIDI